MALAELSRPSPNNEFWPATSLRTWRESPETAFSDWLASQRVLQVRQLRETSCETYSAIFSSWLKALEVVHLNVLEATPADATRFLAEKTQANRLDPMSRRRYLQLLDKVYQHLNQLGWEHRNPMKPELENERLLDVPPPSAILPEHQEALNQYLAELPGWKGSRDRAMAALLMGAGLRANELILLDLGDVSADYEVSIRPEGVHAAHTSIILPDGPWRPWYDAWVVHRLERGFPGSLVFPATTRGVGFSPSGLFRCVRGWIASAKIQAPHKGPNVLRNTFAKQALSCGRYSVEQVQLFLGHEESRATERHLQEAS